MAQNQGKAEIVRKFVCGSINATIFKNVNEELQVYHTIVIERTYKDKEGKWQHTSMYRDDDLWRIELVTQKAKEYLALKTYTQEDFNKKGA